MKQSFPQIYPVACHTDNVGRGSTFVAVQGMQEDGTRYIAQALEQGATKIVVHEDAIVAPEVLALLKAKKSELVRVKNPRKALAQLSAQTLQYPAQKLKIIGVTGTKGKTTTCFLLEHFLAHAGYKTALLSTVYNKIGNAVLKTSLTTQHPDYLHVFFDQCVKQNVEYVVMEVAAQAISLHRVEGLLFEGVIFTNFDLEHSEFYASMDDYFAGKCKIFEHAKPGAPKVVNADDTWCKKIAKTENFVEFSFLKSEAQNFGVILSNNATGLKIFAGETEFFCSTLVGEFNAYNILATLSLLGALNISRTTLQTGLETFAGVPGRMQLHTLPNGARGCIDNAHNPSSYKALLSTLKILTDDLIVVFGCGGQRDTIKRPIMGSIAGELADRIILTSDNPRTEDPAKIIEDIYAGIAKDQQYKVVKELDRKIAIQKAYELSKPTSIIAILGKGHDEYQLINGVKSHFSEREILEHLT